jgi:PilZ domain
MTTTLPNRLRNRRSDPRNAPRGSVKLECRRGSTGLGKNIVAQFLDIAEGGARLVVSQALAANEEVEVLIFASTKIKRLANISWVLPLDDGNYCVGLEFKKKLLFAELSQSVKP